LKRKKPMGTMVCLGMLTFFAMLGHGLLLESYGLNGQTIPLKQLLFPWPKKGRSVAGLCFLMAFLSLCLLLTPPNDFEWSDPRIWKVSVIVWLPLLIYVGFIIPRLKRLDGEIIFQLDPYKKTSRKTLRGIFAMLVIANILYFVFWRK
jgi:hypothetical protein